MEVLVVVSRIAQDDNLVIHCVAPFIDVLIYQVECFLRFRKIPHLHFFAVVYPLSHKFFETVVVVRDVDPSMMGMTMLDVGGELIC